MENIKFTVLSLTT